MLYLIVAISLSIVFLLLIASLLHLIQKIILRIDEQALYLKQLKDLISKVQTDLRKSDSTNQAERNQVIEIFNKRLDQIQNEAIARDNLTQSHLNRTIRQLNNGFYPEELEFPK